MNKQTPLEINPEVLHSKQFLDLLIENIPDMIFVKDVKTLRFVAFNKAGEELLGYNRTDLLGKTDYDLFPKAQADYFTQKDRAVIEGGRVVDIPAEEIQTKNGLRILHTKKIPLFNRNGYPQYLLGISEDVTEKLAAFEQQLKMRAIEESENSFRSLVDTVPVFISISEKEKGTTFLNRGWQMFTGRSIEQDLGEGWTSLLRPEDLERLQKVYKEAYATNSEYEVTYKIRNRHDKYRWVFEHGIPRYDSKGEISGYISSAVDIHERKTSSDAQTFLAQISQALSTSLDYKSHLSRVAKIIVPELADVCFIDILEPGSLTPHLIAIESSSTKKISHLIESRESWPDTFNPLKIITEGSSQLHTNITEPTDFDLKSAILVPISSRGNYLGALSIYSTKESRTYDSEDLLLVEKIGRRIGIAIENSSLYTMAQRAISLRDEFLSIASHELKTPLTSLYLQLQMVDRELKKKTGKPILIEAISQRINLSLRQTQALAELVDTLLDVSRIGLGKVSLKKEETDLSELAKDISHRFSEEAKKVGSEIVINAEPAIKGQWDKPRLNQAITNLISNAIKYGRGTTIGLSIKEEESHALFTIEDHGIGIAKKDHKRIFDRFERAVPHQNVSGMGLGLYITNEIIKAHGGEILLESEINEGSKFTLKLPLGDNSSKTVEYLDS